MRSQDIMVLKTQVNACTRGWMPHAAWSSSGFGFLPPGWAESGEGEGEGVESWIINDSAEAIRSALEESRCFNYCHTIFGVFFQNVLCSPSRLLQNFACYKVVEINWRGEGMYLKQKRRSNEKRKLNEKGVWDRNKDHKSNHLQIC